jgi:hypothetical protein
MIPRFNQAPSTPIHEYIFKSFKKIIFTINFFWGSFQSLVRALLRPFKPQIRLQWAHPFNQIMNFLTRLVNTSFKNFTWFLLWFE